MRNIITQKLREGYEFKAFQYIEQGWKIYSANWIQYTIAIIVFSFSISILSLLPLGAILAGLLLSPLFEAGCYIVANKQLENEKTTFQDFLSGKEHIGGLVMAAFFYFLIIIGVIILIVISLSIPTAVIIKTYDFSNGLLASGALFPVIGLSLAGLLIVMAFLVCYIYAFQYVVFAGMEGGEAIGTSRRIVMRQFGKNFSFMIILGVISSIFTFSVLYFSGALDSSIQLMQAAFTQDLDSIRELQENVNYIPQIVGSVVASIFTPFFYCIRQAAFRDIHDMYKDTEVDNTIEHLIS